jgi:hypothetical protein
MCVYVCVCVRVCVCLLVCLCAVASALSYFYVCFCSLVKSSMVPPLVLNYVRLADLLPFVSAARMKAGIAAGKDKSEVTELSVPLLFNVVAVIVGVGGSVGEFRIDGSGHGYQDLVVEDADSCSFQLRLWFPVRVADRFEGVLGTDVGRVVSVSAVSVKLHGLVMLLYSSDSSVVKLVDDESVVLLKNWAKAALVLP